MALLSRGTKQPARQPKIKALTFDVFGTTVDWVGGMTGHAQRLFDSRGVRGNPDELVREWRAHYQPAIKPVREGKREWVDFDRLHREELDKIIEHYGAAKLSSEDRDQLTAGWRYLKAWPDVVPALHRLKKHFMLAPLSNGTTRQLIETARFASLPWDAIFGADMFRTYKPDPRVYLGAVGLLGLEPGEVLMVAAHNNDLQGAQKHGLQTCFVQRSTEDAKPEGSYDYVVDNFEHLARTLNTV